MSQLQYAGAVILVLALLFLLIGVLQRKGLARFQFPLSGRSGQKLMEVMERLPLTQHHSLHLVRVGGEVLLVGVSPSGCALLRDNGADLVKALERV